MSLLKKYIVTRVYTHEVVAECMVDALAVHEESEHFGDLLQMDEYLINNATDANVRTGFIQDETLARMLVEDLMHDIGNLEVSSEQFQREGA